MLDCIKRYGASIKQFDLNPRNFFSHIIRDARHHVPRSCIRLKPGQVNCAISTTYDWRNPDGSLGNCKAITTHHVIDKNKMYPQILANLKHLISLNYTQHTEIWSKDHSYASFKLAAFKYPIGRDRIVLANMRYHLNDEWHETGPQFFHGFTIDKLHIHEQECEDQFEKTAEDRCICTRIGDDKIQFDITQVVECSFVKNTLGSQIRDFYQWCLKNGCMQLFKTSMVAFIGKMAC